MPTFQFEAMDATGREIKDVIEAPTEEEAQATIRQMGYFVTKIAVKKARKKAAAEKAKSGKKARLRDRRRQLARCSPRSRGSFRFCRTPVCRFLRSLRILEEQAKPGRLQELA